MTRSSLPKIVGQVVLYAAFAATIGHFSHAPAYQHLGQDQGLIRLSFKHAGQFKVECRQRSAEELAKLPAQLRVAADCPRERSPVRVRVELDGRTLVDESFPASGLHHDGPASGYRRIPVAAGEHRLKVAFNDSVRDPRFQHVREALVTMKPGQVVLIDFAPEHAGVLIQ